MMKARSLAVLALCSAGCTAAMAATGPAFDCRKATGEVEQQVCSDASLGALDRQLDTVFQAALAKAKGKTAAQLRAEQRGWVKGRNDCWKAKGQQTWITATWTVDTVKGCIDAQYRVRTSELQAVWRLLPPKTVSYTCQNNPAHEVVANFFASDPATIRLERADRSVTLWHVGQPGVGSYEGQNVAVVHQGNALRVSWLDTRSGRTDVLDCKAR